ncbi:prephenate dehydrogenase [Acholeplasma granularum]|uniref:prephenate dehydrogenase n=1 Tax=Acholeplasma granularum TaxID=264635 RepID=UPI0004B528F7|nr:prephenate dehydrogenase [Acholeplasma granularum]
MKVFIVGLGLMGASYAQMLTNLGYSVYGYDKNEEVLEYAKKDKVILGTDLKYLKSADLVILALYPNQNIDFVKKYLEYFDSQLVTDISGSKTHLLETLFQLLPNTVRYLSHHPMAGREKSGYFNKDISMFKGANFIIIDSNKHTPDDLKVLKKLAKDFGFKNITILSATAHDHLIAHTSQLTHLLAVGLMLIDHSDKTKDATGDSFRDLTRIANINETMWTELFLDNKNALIEKTDEFIKTLESIKYDIQSSDAKSLKDKLIKSKQRRMMFDENKSKSI